MKKQPNKSQLNYCVRAMHCNHDAIDEKVYETLVQATNPLTRSWKKLQDAKSIVIKFNQDWPLDDVLMFNGLRQQLVSDPVVRATLRLLRERTSAKLYCADASFHLMYGRTKNLFESTTIAHLLREFDIEYIDGTKPPFIKVNLSGTGQMFEQYLMMKAVVEADQIVSVAKMKNHGLTGITGSLKNLFGLQPGSPYGRPRHYYHHRVRIPYVLVDLGQILNPALNIIDALVGQAGQEWGEESNMGRLVNALIAGDHAVATDTCAVHLMGHDPRVDWPTPPFLRERNMLRVASDAGFGTVNLDEIDFESEVKPRPKGDFFAKQWGSPETIVERRRTLCEEALYFRDNLQDFSAYQGEYIILQKGEVKHHGIDGKIIENYRKDRGVHPNHATFFKFVDLDEYEGENYDVYEYTLQSIKI